MPTLHNRQRWHAAHAAPPRVDAAAPVPTPAEAATALGTDDGALDAAGGIVRAVLWALSLWLVGAIAAAAVLWPH